MLRQRLIFGLLFGLLFIAAIALDSYCSTGWPLRPWATPPGTFIALACILLIPFAIREMQTLLSRENVAISMRITVVAALLCMLWPWIEQVSESINHQQAASSSWWNFAQRMRTVKPHYLVPTIMALSLVAAVVMHSRKQKVDGAMANAGGTLLAITYLGVLPGFFLPICLTHTAWMLLAIVAIVKAADIGAYTTGHLIGKHKLIPWLSPGKTVEGFFGGLVLSALLALTLALFHRQFFLPPATQPSTQPTTLALALLHHPFSPSSALIAGLLLGAVGQLGDLLESLLKRDAGVKDSGKVPGFGGILDLLDSPLLAAPVAYWLLKLI